ncbi:unnamed protein product [Heterobilharzia americana]|nr:unnamed protein product [Heterobilharzia americana]
MITIYVENIYYEGSETDLVLSSANEIIYFVPMYVDKGYSSVLNLTYKMNIRLTSVSGNFTFYAGAPSETFETTIFTMNTVTTTSPNGAYGHLYTGQPFIISLCSYVTDNRCSDYTQWILQIWDKYVMNITKVVITGRGENVWFTDTFKLTITYLQNTVKVEFGRLCVIAEYFNTICMDYYTQIFGDTNFTSTRNFNFPSLFNIGNQTKNVSSGSFYIPVTPSYPTYNDMIIELTPPNIILQPGQIGSFTIKYVLPLNSVYTMFTVKINGSGGTSNSEAVLTVKGFKINLGSNLASVTSSYSSSYAGDYQTGQLDQLTIYFDKVVNKAVAGSPLMRSTLFITVDIQLTDTRRADIGTVWPLQFTSKFTSSSAVTKYNTSYVKCTRTGLEKPVIQLLLSQLLTNSLQDCSDRNQVYLQTLVRMQNETGLECETQSINFYFGSAVESIKIFSQNGSMSPVVPKSPLDPVTRTAKFSTSRLYFGQEYTVIFQIRFPKSSNISIVKLPVLAEVVCKPYMRSISLSNQCIKSSFFRFISQISLEVDYRSYTYLCDLPHYIAMSNSQVESMSSQVTTFLNVGDRLFYCGRAFSRKRSFERERRCFMISQLPGRKWLGKLS